MVTILANDGHEMKYGGCGDETVTMIVKGNLFFVLMINSWTGERRSRGKSCGVSLI